MFAIARPSKSYVRCRAARLSSERHLCFVPTDGLLATSASHLLGGYWKDLESGRRELKKAREACRSRAGTG